VRDWLKQTATVVADAFDRVTPMRAILAAFVAGLIIVHGLVRQFTIDGMTIALLGILAVLVLTPLLQSATFVGGGVKFKEVENLAKKARALREDVLLRSGVRVVTAPPGSVPAFAAPTLKHLEADAVSDEPISVEISRDDSVEIRPPVVAHTTYAETLAQAHGSPQLALLRLREQLEVATSRLLTSRDLRPNNNLLADTRALVRAQILPPTAAEAIRQFIDVRNRIAHGDFSADDGTVLAMLDIGVSILNTIELLESGPLPGPPRAPSG
jgi:hypothetical protein